MLPRHPRARTATYSLTLIKTSVTAGRRIVTEQAATNLRSIPLSAADIDPCILALDERHVSAGGDFYKTMPATNLRAAARGLYQDVYRATYKGVRLYIKLQLDGDYAVVIQLKRR